MFIFTPFTFTIKCLLVKYKQVKNGIFLKVFMFILLVCFHMDVTMMESSQDFNLILILFEVFPQI